MKAITASNKASWEYTKEIKAQRKASKQARKNRQNKRSQWQEVE